MELRKITVADFLVVDEFLKLGKRGYPQGDLAILQHDFSEEGLSLIDSLFLIYQGEEPIGLIGTFDADWGSYLVGPVFKESYETLDRMEAVLADFIKDKEIHIDVPDSNPLLKQALDKMRVPVKSKSIAMFYELEDFIPVENSSQIVEISAHDAAYIKEVHELFVSDLRPWGWRDGTEAELQEVLADNTKVAILKSEAQVVGAIMWDWDSVTHEGELEYLCVKKGFHGRGFGKELVNYVLSQIRRELVAGKNNEFYLDVSQENERASAFYQALGFQVDYARSLYVNAPKEG